MGRTVVSSVCECWRASGPRRSSYQMPGESRSGRFRQRCCRPIHRVHGEGGRQGGPYIYGQQTYLGTCAGIKGTPGIYIQYSIVAKKHTGNAAGQYTGCMGREGGRVAHIYIWAAGIPVPESRAQNTHDIRPIFYTCKRARRDAVSRNEKED